MSGPSVGPSVSRLPVIAGTVTDQSARTEANRHDAEGRRRQRVHGADTVRPARRGNVRGSAQLPAETLYARSRGRGHRGRRHPLRPRDHQPARRAPRATRGPGRLRAAFVGAPVAVGLRSDEAARRRRHRRLRPRPRPAGRGPGPHRAPRRGHPRRRSVDARHRRRSLHHPAPAPGPRGPPRSARPGALRRPQRHVER